MLGHFKGNSEVRTILTFTILVMKVACPDFPFSFYVDCDFSICTSRAVVN